MIDCAESLNLLSDFHDGQLNETGKLRVQEHLDCCGPCAGVFADLDSIVLAASSLLRVEQLIKFPDEDAIWRRMALAKRTLH